MNLKILIVDDEIDYCTIMKSYFRGKNYDVFLGYTIKECLENLEQHQPDILLLDNNLPDGKGWNLVDSLIKNFPSLRIYLISAYHKKEDFQFNHKNVTVWEKPLSLGLLDQTFPGR